MEEQLDQSARRPTRTSTPISMTSIGRRAGSTGALPESPASPGDPFDVLIINICSLAWHDVEASGLTGHPVWPTSTSVSTIQLRHLLQRPEFHPPAARASCGQTSHQGLYDGGPSQCLLFREPGPARLCQTGRHGITQGFWQPPDRICSRYAGLDINPMDKGWPAHDPRLPSMGNPSIADDALFGRWLNERDRVTRNVTFFNLIALHDGNRYVALAR